MLPRHEDPIVAIASAPGRGAVGIVRASGRDLAPLVAAVCGRALPARHATYLPFVAADGEPIDRGLAIRFPAPHSYTGEEVLELHAHGGPVVLQLLLARCLEAMPGLRLAAPGEFTERAFLNDKLDLAQAEAVADLIDASTEAAARSASRSLAGAFSKEVDALRDALVELRTLVEATLDFPDEEIDVLHGERVQARLLAIEQRLVQVRARARQGALLREGIKVVLAGQPNVGKSSLLNALAGAELAIVTPIAGTTRDKVSQTIQIDGVPLHVIDTAGLRETLGDEVERIGVGRSWEAIGSADLVLFVHDLAREGDARYAAGEAAVAARLARHAALAPRIVHVHNKADLVPAAANGLAVSATSGWGLDRLRARLLEAAGWEAAGGEGVYLARARHLQALDGTRQHLQLARRHAAAADPALELLAEELRLAHRRLGEITGAFSADDLLGEIFGRFCIGK